MKKLLLGITGVSLLLIFTLASCENGTTSTNLTTTSMVGLQTLAAPTNVKAIGFGETGVIRVTWEPVANAAGYHVYRKSVAPSNQGGETQWTFKAAVQRPVSTPTPAAAFLGIEDIISQTNEFKPDVTYTYKVVALTNWSSSPYGTNTWPAATANADNVDLVLQNSASADSNGVKFDAPSTDPKKKPKNPLSPAGSQLKTPEITLTPVKTYSATGISEELQVSWNASPGVKYIVYYSYGSDVLVFYNATGFVNSITYTAGQTKAISRFPLINGKTNVQVVAQQSSGTYYADSEPAVENYEGAQTILAAVTLTAGRAGNVVALSWNDDYPGATYQVYRFKAKDTGSGGYVSGGYIFDDWEEITDKINAFNAGGNWIASDSDMNEENQGYVYMLIATLGDAKSIPAAASVQSVQNDITAQDPYARALPYDPDLKKFRGAQITWTSEYGQTYKLSRKAVLLDDVTFSAVIGPKDGSWDTGWVDVSGIPSPIPTPNNTGANMGLIDEPPVKDAYMYKLVTTQGSLTAEKYVLLSDYPYYNAVDVELGLSNQPDVQKAVVATPDPWSGRPENRGTPYTVGVTITTNKDELKALLLDADTVNIYRAKYDNNNSEESGTYVLAKSITKSSLDNKEFVDTPPEPGYYKYKAVVVSGGNQLKNTKQHTPNVIATSYTKAVPSLVNVPATGTRTGSRFEYTSFTTTGSEYIKGQKLYYKYIDADSAPTTDAEWLDVAATELTYDRTLDKTKASSVDLYFTGAVTAPASTATTTRYYRLYALKGDGTREIISDGTIPKL
jgi:hypothetical protein